MLWLKLNVEQRLWVYIMCWERISTAGAARELVRAGTGWSTGGAPWAPEGTVLHGGSSKSRNLSAVSPLHLLLLWDRKGGLGCSSCRHCSLGEGLMDEPSLSKSWQEEKPHLEVPPCVKVLRVWRARVYLGLWALLAGFVTDTQCPCLWGSGHGGEAALYTETGAFPSPVADLSY